MNRIRSIQALRGIAFLMIFFSHIDLGNQGSGGVSVFFVLSGFLLMLKYQDKAFTPALSDSLAFSWKHIRKLYWLHIIMSLSALPFLVRAMEGNRIRIAGRLLANVLLIHAWFPPTDIRYSLNNVSWFLSAMLFLYLLFPYIRRSLSRYDSVWRLTGALTVVAAVQFFWAFGIHLLWVRSNISYAVMKGLIYNLPAARAADFTIGCILGRIYTQKNHIESGRTFHIFLLSVFILSCVIREFCTNPATHWLALTILPLPGSCCIIWHAICQRNHSARSILFRGLEYLGNISGPAFLIHLMIRKYAEYYYPPVVGTLTARLLLAVAAMFLTVLLSRLWIWISGIRNHSGSHHTFISF